MPSTNNSTTTPENATSTPLKLCYANKCRILLAKGILRAPVACAKGRNICPGCIIEGTRQRKTATAEIEIMEANTPNQVLAPILDSMITPISIKQLRQLLQHLPTMNFTKRDDSIFGVIRYIANSLGLRLTNAPAGSIDETLTSIQIREKWRQATFSCKCQHTNIEQKIHGDRAFCSTCSFIIHHHNPPSNRCPGCLMQDSWTPTASSCLACQFATVIYRNRFHTRYSKYIDQWLPTLATDSEDDTVDQLTQPTRATARTPESHEELHRLRQLSLQNSFSEIKARSSPKENTYVIENLTLLQRDIQLSAANKRGIDSLHSASEDPRSNAQQEDEAPRKKNSLKQALFDDTASQPSGNCTLGSCSTRLPLAPIDINSMLSSDGSMLSRRKQKKNNRIAAAKLHRHRKHMT